MLINAPATLAPPDVQLCDFIDRTVRTQGDVTCNDAMSRDVVTIARGDGPERARQLLIAHNIRTLPVIDEAGRLLGTIDLRELTLQGDAGVAELMSEARTARVRTGRSLAWLML